MSDRDREKREEVMDSRERRNFRHTKVWLEFRTKMKKMLGGVDVLTLKPLQKSWNLHHGDQRKENYKNLDEDRFFCLNKQSHDCIHFLYRYWLTDKDILRRLEEILKKMEELSNDNKGKG